MILLTDEEIWDCSSRVFKRWADPPMVGDSQYDQFSQEVEREIAKAQLKKVVEHIKDESWWSFNSYHDKIRVMWNEDWESLLKEVE